MRQIRFLFGVLTVILASICSAYSQSNILEMKTGHLTFTNTNILDALVMLANDVKVPFGIACADDRFSTTRVSADIDRKQLGQALGTILSRRNDLQFRVEHGVIVVQPIVMPDECHYLNLVIPEFSAQPDSAQHLSAKLWMMLESQLDGSRVGFTGVIHPKPEDRQIGPVELTGKSVMDILDWIVGHHGTAAWVSFPSKDPKSASLGKLWELSFYDTGKEERPAQ